MKLFDAKDNTYTDFPKEVHEEDLNFKVGDHVKLSKYKNIFSKRYTPNWSEEVFMVKVVKNTVPWSYFISDLNCEKMFGTF